MSKASDWLVSFNSHYQDQINAMLAEKKTSHRETVTISITGGKGGVGKTSVSLKLAKELSKQNKKVLLIDCDYNLSNTAIKLGLPLNNTFFSLLSAQKDFDDCLYQDGNFHLLSACNGSLDLFDSEFKMEEFIIDIINEHGKDYDYVLLDCPAGLLRESLTLNAYCDKRIVVVTPDRASITDSYSLMKILSMKYGIKENHLVVNMITSKVQFEKVVKTLSETVENFLGCRTQILGGIGKINVEAKNFDLTFLGTGKNDHHQSFLKVVKKLTEELGRQQIGMRIPSQQSNVNLEQDVQ